MPQILETFLKNFKNHFSFLSFILFAELKNPFSSFFFFFNLWRILKVWKQISPTFFSFFFFCFFFFFFFLGWVNSSLIKSTQSNLSWLNNSSENDRGGRKLAHLFYFCLIFPFYFCFILSVNLDMKQLRAAVIHVRRCTSFGLLESPKFCKAEFCSGFTSILQWVTK